MNIEELLSKIYALFEIERNTENLCEIPDNLYKDVSSFMEKIQNNTSNSENTNDALIYEQRKILSNITLRLLEIRMDKTLLLSNDEYYSLLTSEEQYIIEPLSKYNKRNNEIKESIAKGNYTFLESLKDKQSKYTTVKFLNDTPSMVGNDLVKYGPFVKEEIATIPLENANILIKQNIVKEFDVES